MANSELGDFLTSRRAQVKPADAGLPVVGLRRVPGLRREEVATLAGVSVDYYVRLEQGRERHPSAQVVAHGEAPDDPRLRQVLAGLLRDQGFADEWAQHHVRAKSLQRKQFRHPEVGSLELTMQTFAVRGSPGQELVVYHAEPGSAAAQALRLLGSLAATRALR